MRSIIKQIYSDGDGKLDDQELATAALHLADEMQYVATYRNPLTEGKAAIIFEMGR